VTNYANHIDLTNTHRDFTREAAMKREDVKALKDQLERLEASEWQKRVNERADEIASAMRAKIIALGEVPCA
jgi:hypothetical protein